MALYLPRSSPWAKDLMENGAEYMRIVETTERLKEEERRAALRANAPPLTFADHIYSTGEPQQ